MNLEINSTLLYLIMENYKSRYKNQENYVKTNATSILWVDLCYTHFTEFSEVSKRKEVYKQILQKLYWIFQ